MGELSVGQYSVFFPICSFPPIHPRSFFYPLPLYDSTRWRLCSMAVVNKMDSASDNLTLWGNVLWRLSTYSFGPAVKTIWKFYGVLMFTSCGHLYCFHSQGKMLWNSCLLMEILKLWQPYYCRFHSSEMFCCVVG